MTSWDEVQYLKFADERTRPARELLARVPLVAPERIIDLGCGPGNSTALLRERFPHADLIGVDSSAEMLKRARADVPGVIFSQADVADFRPDRPQDLLFANAVLHWLPAHETLLPALLAQLRHGGVLAFQVPCNDHEPSHRLMRELPGPWSARLSALQPGPRVGSPAFYYDLLAPHGRSIDIWQTTYQHVMDDADAIVEWVRGTGLRPFLDALHAAERPAYVAAYTAAIDAAYPRRADAKRLFAFPRLSVVVVR